LKKLIYSINPVDSLQNTPSSLSLPVEKETFGQWTQYPLHRALWSVEGSGADSGLPA